MLFSYYESVCYVNLLVGREDIHMLFFSPHNASRHGSALIYVRREPSARS